MTFGIGILRRIKPAGGIRHFAFNVFESFADNSCKEFISGDLKQVKISEGQLGIVIQHLFKVRNQPFRVG